MERWQKILINALVTGGITALTIISLYPVDQLGLATLYSAVIAGAISALRELKAIDFEPKGRVKRKPTLAAEVFMNTTIF